MRGGNAKAKKALSKRDTNTRLRVRKGLDSEGRLILDTRFMGARTMTQAQLAQHLNVSVSTIKRIERDVARDIFYATNIRQRLRIAPPWRFPLQKCDPTIAP